MRPHNAVPAHVMQIGHDTLLATLSAPKAASAAGVHVKTLLKWNRLHWKIRLRRDPMAPKRWRCCNRINLTERCTGCGHIPTWAA